jgi:plasmid stability protein
MATIQVRDIPDDVYDTIRRRAQEAGQSLQAYMRDQVVAMGSRPTRAEILAEWERELHQHPTTITREQILADLDDIRGR